MVGRLAAPQSGRTWLTNSQAAPRNPADVTAATPPIRSPAALALGTSRVILLAFLAVFMFVAVTEAASLQFPGTVHTDGRMADWQAFTISGQLTAEGRAADTYDWTVLQAEQRARSGTDGFMPWVYPPPFTLLTAPLALLPVGWSYLVTQLALLAWFLSVVRRAAGEYLPAALTFTLPALLTNLACGQNGFLTGALIGSFLLALRNPAAGRPTRGGWALGGMLVKPHLAVAIALLALLERRWQTLALAAAITLGAAAVTTALLGPAIWGAFLQSSHLATTYLWAGDYPLERMSSTYACVARLGAGPALAMAVHTAVALAALGALVWAWWRGVERDWLLALAGAVSLQISPYAYDYDMPVLAVAVALVWPAILRRASGAEVAGLAVLAWLGCGNGIWAMANQIVHPGVPVGGVISLSAPALVGLIAATALILRRPAG